LVNAGPNSAQAERWAGAAGHHWVEHEADYDRQLADCGTALIDAARLDGQAQVLDVGCGTGTTAIAAARHARRVLGVDLSPVMIERARARAGGCANVDFEVADAQTAAFEAAFDVVISRFGLMFFADARAAFANLRLAVVPGGRLAAVCWQSLDRNDWMRVPGEALAQVVPLGDIAEPGQPGPFSLGSREELTRLLADTGWDDVAVDGLTFPVPVGGARSLDDAVEFVRGGSLGRSALAGVSPAVERRALGAVRDALAPYATGEGVLLAGAAWLVRASNGATEAPRR
jgi:SAM-dependent methyltransferase